jgi:hypothetical protein
MRYALTATAVRNISEGLRRFWNDRGQERRRYSRRNSPTRNVQFVKVLALPYNCSTGGSGSVSSGGSGTCSFGANREYYDAEVIDWDSKHETETSLGRIYLDDVNGKRLFVGNRYMAMELGDVCIDGDERPHFRTGEGFGTIRCSEPDFSTGGSGGGSGGDPFISNCSEGIPISSLFRCVNGNAQVADACLRIGPTGAIELVAADDGEILEEG